MRWIRFAVLIVGATIVQANVVGVMALRRAEIRPDLLLILLVFFATRCRANDVVITSFTIGFAADLISPTMGLMGPQIISFGICGTILSDLHNIVSVRRVPHQIATIFVVGLLTALAGHLLTFLRTEPVAPNLLAEMLWQPLYSAVLGPLLFLPTAWWMRMNRAGRWRSGPGSESG
ncbi:MAG: rod shape-determining protein MreD [Sedimentisphaerales bacterium]|nr:rod shape-determining protein MreD [Sedimentisphaerales bacterium]